MHSVNQLMILFLATALCFSVGCGNREKNDGESHVYQDEAHRPSEWQCDMRLTLAPDTINDEVEQLVVIESEGNPAAADLLSQLWMMAFSGDAEVFPPDLFGEIDETQPLTPQDLIDFLREMDTSAVEDLISGELKDTVVDISFEQNHVNELVLYFQMASMGEELSLSATHVAIGEQVFDMSGSYRGIRPRFFVRFKRDEREANFQQNLVLRSDSNGFIGVHSFKHYRGNEDRPMQEWIGGSNVPTKVQLKLDMNYSARALNGTLYRSPAES